MQISPDILESKLGDIITRIGREYCIGAFVNNPDFLEERLIKWHQFGLLSHTKRVRNIFLNELKDYLDLWRLDNIRKYLKTKIDGCERRILLEISILLHDLGKIALTGDNRVHRNHEKESESIILKLGELKELSEKQLGYIIKCVNSHDIIGKEVRDYLISKNKFNFEFLNSNKMKNILGPIIKKNSDVKVEMGIFYLCDSLGKTDIIVNVDTNEEKVIEILKKKKLPLELKNGVMQLPLNVKLAEIYLKNI